MQIANPSIICAFTATLTSPGTWPPGAPFSLSADYGTITVEADKLNLSTDLGTYAFTLTVTSASVPQVVGTF